MDSTSSLASVFTKLSISFIPAQGVHLVQVQSEKEAIEKTKKLLCALVNERTNLFLSGGKTPQPLYEELTKDSELRAAGVGLIDERYGKAGHIHSNEKMIKDTGFLKYLHILDIPFYPILQEGLTRTQTAQKYDEKLRELFFQIPTSIGILGIGSDGHTAGIAPHRRDFKNPLYTKEQENLLVSEFNDNGVFGERITMTFKALSLLDVLVVLVLGSSKQKALKQLFTKGSLEEVPARFYVQDHIAKKTILITDQKI